MEEWSWIERRKDTVQLNSSKHSLQDLSGFAREGRRGVCPGACVFRHRDQLWIPLTEVCSNLPGLGAACVQAPIGPLALIGVLCIPCVGRWRHSCLLPQQGQHAALLPDLICDDQA